MKIGALLVTLLLLFSCTDKDNKQSRDFIIRTTQAIPGFGQNITGFPFIAQPFRTSELSFRVGGPIDRFEVYAGNSYRRGSTIAEIDPRDFHIHREQAETIYCQARAEFERIEKLYEKNNVSANTYEEAKADYTTARAAFGTAPYGLEDARLITPFNGYVGEVYIERFQDVKAIQSVISFIDIDRLRMETCVTQDIAFVSHPGDTAQIRFDVRPDKVCKAGIMEISKGTTRNNLSYLLTTVLPNEKGELLAGMSGKAISDVPRITNSVGVSIPWIVLCHRPSEGGYVWVINTNTHQVNHRQVKKGNLPPNGCVIMIEGLRGNETMTISELHFLSDGIKVTISSKANSL